MLRRRSCRVRGKVRVVKQAKTALGRRYDHYQPANHLMRSPGTLLDDVDPATVERFERLFARLNALLA